MTRVTIASTGPVDQVAVRILEPFGDIVCAQDGTEPALLAILGNAVGLIVRGDSRAGARVISAAPLLRVIGRTGAGYDSVDIEAATARGIPVLYTPGANARAVAEAAMALLLALAKKLVYWDGELKAGNWRSRYGVRSADLEGAVLGILGFGSTGRILAELARPFRMTVLAHDPYADRQAAAGLGVHLTGLHDLLARADYVSLHVALTAETRGMIDRAAVALMKPGACLVNLSRGGVIESLDVLHEALTSGRLSGVGLDVFDPEPPDVRHPLFGLPQCLASPHALATTPRAMENIFRILAEDMASFFRGERPRWVVNPVVLERAK
jgi:phosphoglycerate dehydrogenase-like enzyme